MSRLDDIQAKLDAKMAEIMRRIDADSTPTPVLTPTPPPTPALQSPLAAISSGTPISTSTSPSLAVHAWPPPPTDDSSQPTLNNKDLYALAPFDIYVVGLKPGDPYPHEGKRYPGDPGNPADDVWERVVEAAKQANVKLGSCYLFLSGKGDPVDDKLFIGPSLYCRAVADAQTSIEEGVLINVEKAVSYYLEHWGYRDIMDVCVLWAWARADADQNWNIRRVAYIENNAFSAPRNSGSTFLCFTPDSWGLETTAHEFTHSVTDRRVGWSQIYRGETGAINESFSDIFGKFVHWAWEGRQLNDPQRWIYDGIRNMAHPDRPVKEKMMSVPTGSGKSAKIPWIPASYYLQGVAEGNAKTIRSDTGDKQVGYGWYRFGEDNGGVHINNGVIARLCYLLCEGEVFNRDDGRCFNVEPIGLARTEELFGTILFGQRRYLPSACNMYAFYNGITLAAQDLGFSPEERDRLLVACDAVNIVPKQASSKFGNLSMEGFSMRNAVSEASGSTRRSYTKILAEALSGELGLHVAGAGFSVDEESVVEMPDLHAAVPTGGEVQVTFSQTWNGLPVFGSYAMARVRDGERITHFQNGFSSALGRLSTHVTADEKVARRTAESEFPGSAVSSVRKIVFDPALLGLGGSATVAWKIELRRDDAPAGMCVISATDGSVLHRASSRIVD